MKASTTFALAALVGSQAAFAVPRKKPLDYEKQVMLDNYMEIKGEEGLCLEWKAVKNPNDWVHDSVKGGKKYWPNMQAECVSWEMPQGERDFSYTVSLAAGSPETCRDWQVKVDDNYHVSPICMADIPQEVREDPAFKLNDEFPLVVKYLCPQSNATETEKTEQPSMQVLETAYQAGDPYKECAAWKVISRGWDAIEFEPGVAAECWKWKDSSEEVKNYTIITGKYKFTCTSPKGYVVRLDGDTAYAQCGSTPDVGFNKSITYIPDPFLTDPDYHGRDGKRDLRRQAQPSTPGVTFIDQDWVSHAEFGHRADFYCTEWVVSHAEGHPDVLLPVCHHWNEGEPGQTFPYLVVTGQTHGECKAGWAVKADGPDVYPYCPSADGDKKKDTPGPAPAKDPKAKEPSISYVNEEDVPTQGSMACSAWRLDTHSGTRKVIVPKCAQIKAAPDAPEFYTVVTALVVGDCHTRWEAHTTANRVYPVCAPAGKRPINTANPDQDICDRAPTMVDIEVVSLNEHDRNIAAACGADPKLVNAAEKQHQKEAQDEAEHQSSEETEEIEERGLQEDSEFQEFCERVAKKGDEEVRALTPDEQKTALVCKTGLNWVIETVFNATKAHEQQETMVEERDAMP